MGWAGRLLRRRGIVVLALLGLLALAAPAQAAPDRSITPAANTPSEWDGPSQQAATRASDQDNGGPCGKAPDNYCDVTLINAGERDDAFSREHQASLKTDVGNFPPPTQDFDLYVYES